MAAVYVILQLTWGIIQSLLGLLILIREGPGKEHFWFHGAYVTRWDQPGGISLGMFIFIGDPLMEHGEKYAYLTHEYGHSIQSLIWGPLYVFAIGIPSTRWGKKYNREMLRQGISYFSVYPEGQANVLGEKITGIKVPEHIPGEMFDLYDSLTVELGGVEQFISIRGVFYENPVLLVLHGGPGSTLTGMSHTYQRPWEKHFTVVNWDQRCSGRTGSVSGKTSPVELTVDLMLNDALELTDYLRERFHKDRIIILGHSWGTLLGTRLALEHPEKYLAFISTGTLVSGRGQAEYLAGFFRRKFEEEGDSGKLARLDRIGEYWKEPVQDPDKELAMNWIIIDEGYSSVKARGVISGLRYEIIPMMRAPEYRIKDALNFFGYKAYPRIINQEMPDFNVEDYGLTYEIPVYFINGDMDYQTPYPMALEYFGKITAPDKDFFTLTDCAHCWDIDAPDQMAQVMCGELPGRI
ncbi:MAG: alpha/beta hydrolase, partial [Oscillospiraceae bacterium]|nr:alpha/beta hydrolase [Oscillospiraceae bacterium]